ncbi:GNAT family N-acetyltransferase [Inmirania thermothiophila]|uniref:Acetyltransferase (GNAT) family protein n=1 Tax=Inmirania thermothiophila TaxID=1750597 RepID=A0A3N1Y530_9GAMM|nr:GNAT family N-acetyltransferase [Inmirania thermothiophila]ROR32742.1 acetyltransferase (GNAT) family protein [Inmirania thermothiophila]
MKARRRVRITWLEMREPGWLRPARGRAPAVRRMREPVPEFARFLYETVGGPWLWYERRGWSDAAWAARLADPGVELWVACRGGSPVGYFELERCAGEVQMVHFGLLPRFIGRGWGGPLLARAVQIAWRGQVRRVWLHTCSLDHPAALANYLARGFRIVREESRTVLLPLPVTPGRSADSPASG